MFTRICFLNQGMTEDDIADVEATLEAPTTPTPQYVIRVIINVHIDQATNKLVVDKNEPGKPNTVFKW